VSQEREKCRLKSLMGLDSLRTQAERNRLGQFATPYRLASELVCHAAAMLPARSEIRFLEPGFGSGPFYSALLNSPFAKRVRIARGFEIDQDYGKAAKRCWNGTGLRLSIADFTKVEPPKTDKAKFNLVVCNPPYVRHHHLSQNQKKELQMTVARHTAFKMNGLSGLYTYFMILSKAWMSDDGIGAWLIPSEFMDVNYGRKVKEFLLDAVTLYHIHRCDPEEVQFEDALVSSAIVFFRNSVPPAGHKVEFSLGRTLEDPKLSREVDVDQLRHSTKWTGLVQNSTWRPISGSCDVLDSLFRIKRGLATGCNSFFILTPDRIQKERIPRRFLIPILPSPKDLGTNEVMADEEGIPRIKNPLFLLSCDLPEVQVQKGYPSLWRYLQRGMAEGVDGRYLCRHRSPWYSQEIRPPSPLLCTYMGRPTKRSNIPFRFILNRSAATAANVYLMLYPRSPLDSLLKTDPALLRELWKALSSITSEMLVGEGRVYGGGLHKMEPKELANVSADVIWDILPKRFREYRVKNLFT